jgi:hypothetical protein
MGRDKLVPPPRPASVTLALQQRATRRLTSGFGIAKSVGYPIGHPSFVIPAANARRLFQPAFVEFDQVEVGANVFPAFTA